MNINLDLVTKVCDIIGDDFKYGWVEEVILDNEKYYFYAWENMIDEKFKGVIYEIENATAYVFCIDGIIRPVHIGHCIAE